MIQVAIAATTMSAKRIMYAEGSANPRLRSGSPPGVVVSLTQATSASSSPAASRVTIVPASPRKRAGVSVIEPIAPNQVRFVQEERFTGLLVPLILRFAGESTRVGFESMNIALKRRVEQLGAQAA